jgi:hypothetical protein
MALLNLVYRDGLFPLPAYANAFERLRQRDGDKHACRIIVELLALAHERGCEAELARALEASLEADLSPDIKTLRARFGPNPRALPVVVVKLTAPGAYDELIGDNDNPDDPRNWPGAMTLAPASRPSIFPAKTQVAVNLEIAS